MWMAVMRVGRRRLRWPGTRRDICSMVSRKVTQLSFHSSRPVLPGVEGPSARPGWVSPPVGPLLHVAPSHQQLPSLHPAWASNAGQQELAPKHVPGYKVGPPCTHLRGWPRGCPGSGGRSCSPAAAAPCTRRSGSGGTQQWGLQVWGPCHTGCQRPWDRGPSTGVSALWAGVAEGPEGRAGLSWQPGSTQRPPPGTLQPGRVPLLTAHDQVAALRHLEGARSLQKPHFQGHGPCRQQGQRSAAGVSRQHSRPAS